MLPGAFGYDEITVALAGARPVVLGLRITDAFYHPDAKGLIKFAASDIERGRHAVLAVGYGQTSGDAAFLLIRNSWGPEWGLDGYAWLPRSYVDNRVDETALIT